MTSRKRSRGEGIQRSAQVSTKYLRKSMQLYKTFILCCIMLLSEWLAALKLDCQRVCDPESCESKWKKTLHPHFMKQERQREKKAEKRGWKATEREEEGTTCKLASSQKKWLDGNYCRCIESLVHAWGYYCGSWWSCWKVRGQGILSSGEKQCWKAEEEKRRAEAVKVAEEMLCSNLACSKKDLFHTFRGVQKLLESKVWISVYCVLLLYCIWYLFRRPVPDWVAATPRLQCINFLLV